MLICEIHTFDERPSIFIRGEKQKSLVVHLKGLGAKTNSLAVNRQS
jgi:hypothetical protein